MANDIYDRFKDYDKAFKITASRTIFPPEIYNEIAANIRGAVLDIGTGDGYKLQNILQGTNPERIESIMAIDPSPLYKRAEERFKEFKNIEVYNCCIEDLGLERRFDTILMFEVVEHMPNPEECLHIVATLLKPGGIFICSTPNKWVYRITERMVAKKIDQTHISEMTYKEFIALMGRHFEKTSYIGVLPFMTIGRKFPKLLILNRYLNFTPISRTIYCFATKPRSVD